MKQNLIDRARFVVLAGSGGDGAISWRREKFVPKGGPDGGNGGAGGSIILRSSKAVATLRAFAGKDRFQAEAGRPGGKRQSSGDEGEDLVILVPVGTVVYIDTSEYRLNEGRQFYGLDSERLEGQGFRGDRVRESSFEERFGINAELQILNDKREIKFKSHNSSVTQTSNSNGQKTANNQELITDNRQPTTHWVQVADLDGDGEMLVIARGGRGGLGNEAFKSSRNTTPKVAQRGEKGERFLVKLELKVLADVGLIGLPNVGKSTLLSVLTAAKPEIADYPFTTLSPNLGVMERGMGSTKGTGGTRGKESMGGAGGLVIADIPGLIEEASRGKGLGVEFLKHVERCGLLVHVLAPKIMIKQDKNINNQKTATEEITQVAEEMWRDYQTIRKELGEYGEELLKKPEVVVVNKIDLLQGTGDRIQAELRNKELEVTLVSAAIMEGIEELRTKVQKALQGREVREV